MRSELTELEAKHCVLEERLLELEKEVEELWDNKAAASTFEFLRERLESTRDKVRSNTRATEACLFLIGGGVIILAAIGTIALFGGLR